MPEFRPVTTIGDHRTLDESDLLLGYMDGFDGTPPPGSGHSRAYAHGWRNGMVDAGWMEPDEDYETLATAFCGLSLRH